MLSYDEALLFVEKTLGIPGVKERLSHDRLDLLDEMIIRFQQELPFTNIQLLNQDADMGEAADQASKVGDEDSSCIPSLEDNIRHVLDRTGGLCWTLNSAFLLLLQMLGYDAYVVLSSVIRDGPREPNHLVIIVRGLQFPGDKYMVDVAIGIPTHGAVPLDFSVESPEYSFCQQTMKLVCEDGLVTRLIKRKPSSKVLFYKMTGDWGHFNTFEPDKPVPLEDIRQSINRSVYSNRNMHFHRKLRVFILRQNGFVNIYDKAVIVKKEGEGDGTKTILENHDMVPKIMELIPAMPKEMIEIAVEYCDGLRE